jgi:hypothetical protein
MASLAFLLAPARAIPAEPDQEWLSTVQSFTHVADFRWVELWETLDENERKRVSRFAKGIGLSGNAMDAMKKKEPAIVDAARAFIDEAWNQFRAGGALPVVDSAAAHRWLRLDSKMSLANLVGYAGGFKPIAASKLKHGGAHGFIKSDSDDNAFDFGGFNSIQRALFHEIARGHGGVHLAVWTYGHALHVLVARCDSSGPDAVATVHGPFSLRLAAGDRASRTRGNAFVDAIADALANSAIKPDFDALRAACGQPALSVAQAFAAVGVPGAVELDDVTLDAAAHWSSMRGYVDALLDGTDVDKKALRALTRLLEARGSALYGGIKLPAKLGPPKKRPETARVVADALLDLASIASAPPPADVARFDEVHAIAAVPSDHRAKKRAHCVKMTSSPPRPASLASAAHLVASVGERLRPSGTIRESDGGIVSFCARVAGESEARSLRNDLRGRGLVEIYGAAWLEPVAGGAFDVVGYTCSTLDVALFSLVIADLPVELTLARDHDVIGAWTIKPS